MQQGQQEQQGRQGRQGQSLREAQAGGLQQCRRGCWWATGAILCVRYLRADRIGSARRSDPVRAPIGSMDPVCAPIGSGPRADRIWSARRSDLVFAPIGSSSCIIHLRADRIRSARRSDAHCAPIGREAWGVGAGGIREVGAAGLAVTQQCPANSDGASRAPQRRQEDGDPTTSSYAVLLCHGGARAEDLGWPGGLA